MSHATGGTGSDASSLRARVAAPSDSTPTAPALDAVKNQTDETKEKDRKTYGRTPDGKVFVVPHTEDMVSQLFDPTKPKVALDVVIVVALAWQGVLFYLLPARWRVPVFAAVFLFWRAGYNCGIGWLLHNQSNHQRLVKWARKSRVFEDPTSANRPRLFLTKFLKREMETMIPKDYVFEDAPIEYNTWLLFRRVVDLILMSDFISYCLFAIANTHIPLGENPAMTAARWVGGVILILFNIWVKLDAHRVVGDYAWFWGDFFFFIDQDLTFDGVYELAPQ